MPKPLQAQRKGAYLSVRDLAKRAEVSPVTIWRIEAGKVTNIHPGTMRKIAEVLGVTPGDIQEFVFIEGQ